MTRKTFYLYNMYKKIFFLGLILPITILFLNSCSAGSNEEPDSGQIPTKLSVVDKLVKYNPTILVASKDSLGVDAKFFGHWNEDTHLTTVFTKQNGKLTYIGQLQSRSTEEKVNSPNEWTESITNIDVTGKVDANTSYTVYGLNCIWRRDGDELYLCTKLQRGGSFGSYYYLPVVKGMTGNFTLGNKFSGTCELLYIVNKTDKPITFIHKGFDAEKKWYYTYAEVTAAVGTIGKTEQGEEVFSDKYVINPYIGKGCDRIPSCYIPNGNKIQDAQLVAEIDGKEVRSVNRISSDVVLQNEHCYAIFAVWDGEKLTLGNEESNANVIEFPQDGNINIGDITLLGDGKEQDLDSNGHFEEGASNLIAIDKSGNPIYISYGYPTENRTLNSMETAMSLLLPTIPFSLSDMDDIRLCVLKYMIGYLDETKELAKAIDYSIVQNGYTDIESILPEYTIAVNAIMNRLGISWQNHQHSSLRRVAPNTPYFSNTGSNKLNGEGFTIILDKSEWKTDNQGNLWSCDFTLYNSSCQCYTTVTKCIKNNEDGLYYRENDEIYDTFKYLVKPMNVGEFMDWGTLSDLATNPREFLKSLSEPDFDKLMTFLWETIKPLGNLFGGNYDYFTESTWDKVKVDKINFEFRHSNESIMIAGPGIDVNLLIFNYLKLFFQPILKLIIGDIKKGALYKEMNAFDQLYIGFLEWMAKADLTFRTKMFSTLLDPSKEWSEKLDILEDVYDRFKKFLAEEAYKYISKEIWDNEIKPAFDKVDYDTIKLILKIYKFTLTTGNIIMMCLESDYKGVAFDLRLDFVQPSGTLPVAPGENL